VAKFKKDVEDPKVKEEVLADQKMGTAAGASGTPTFFVNGHQLVGAQPFDQFKTMIDEEIKQADILLKSGTPASEIYKKRAQ
jgi:protein-disulfide isomerase